MTKLEQLIQELCPNGVAFKKLREIATISRGGNLQKKDFSSEGVPCIHYGQIYTQYGLFANKTFTFISDECAKRQKMAVQNDIIMAVTSENIEDVCKCVAWLGNEPVAVSGHTAIIHHNQNARYLTYLFSSTLFQKQKRKFTHGTKVIEVTPDKLNDIVIPIPPLPVQSEIVRILDNFAELTTELTAELTARKKQYEYYRDKLLLQNNMIEYKTLPDISTNYDKKRKPITKEKRDIGIYPYYGASGVVDYVADYIFEGEYLLISEDGANLLARNTPIAFSISGKNWVNNHAHVIQFDNAEMRKYVEFYLNSIDLGQYISGGAQPKLNQFNLNKIPIPIPYKNNIKQIVNILIKFDALCNDLTSGLPAEITARQKQYEYYRDKLLTFREKVV